MSNTECDVLVVGSGAAGMTAALTAARKGLKVIVTEKEPVYGGTSAWSGGFLWVPGNKVCAEAGISDSVEAANEYLKSEAGNFYDQGRVMAFLDTGPEMVEFVRNEGVDFDASPAFSDYHPEQPGGMPGGRSIVAAPMDARLLGDDLARIRRPKKEMTFMGLQIGSGPELVHFFNFSRSLASFAYVTRRMAAHGIDMLRNGRSMRMTNGNALVGRLFHACRKAGVEFWCESPVAKLTITDGQVIGAEVSRATGPVMVAAKKAVVLASGGFPRDPEMTARLYGRDVSDGAHVSAAPEGNTGDGLKLGTAAGGNVIEDLPNAAAWAPVSLVPRGDGTFGDFPHFVCRGKPGVIGVLRTGERFVNEANSYHDFVQALVAATEGKAKPEAFLICDHKTIRRYGLGYVRPSPMPLSPHVRSGYAIKGDTIAELAQNAGIDADGLAKTLELFNADARQGKDTAFHKGSTAYNLFHGDASHKPHPNLAPLENGPFYGIRVIPGDIGTFVGLNTDENAQVLDGEGKPVKGLYAAGNDMLSVMGGAYPGGGITLGPGMTFGYVAANHIAANS
ncbi:MAG: FAD-dependent oxidoreductase [Rhodobacteraceae bacterium]|nr:FAD-dependent oxidoreductase [Paracoccaceae bacterium]